MNKKKLLLVAHHLTIGGVQKSLIAALKVIDYDKYDVTLYLRKNRTDLLSFVDERVSVIINDDKHHYYRKPKAILLQLLIAFFKILKRKDKAEIYNQKLSQFIVKCSMEYEKKHHFANSRFDVAIAYSEGYNTLFVCNYIDAVRKFTFFRTSTDDFHEIIFPIIDEFDKILVLHDNHKKLVGSWYPKVKDKISIIPNYTDKDLVIAQSIAYDVDTKQGKVTLCSCGRLARVKGFDLAVETARVLKKNGFAFLWYFVGDGPERVCIEDLINQYGLQDEILITGMQKNPYPYMAACDIYIQPSYEESLGNTMVEAHKLLKPVVTTATLGGSKLVSTGVNGIVCPISSEGLAQGIFELINNRNLYNSILNNLESIDYSNEYSDYKKQWQKLLEE